MNANPLGLKMTTKAEVKQMIDAAIDQHNKNATLISMAIGFSLLGFYADGLLRVVEKVTAT
jgi:hypothetical protein|tara:strand:+ start:73 stop:255 length:183 start_codon:yes stop_codon:yes gene_type:complete